MQCYPKLSPKREPMDIVYESEMLPVARRLELPAPPGKEFRAPVLLAAPSMTPTHSVIQCMRPPPPPPPRLHKPPSFEEPSSSIPDLEQEQVAYNDVCEIAEDNVAELLDGSTNPEIGAFADRNAEPITERNLETATAAAATAAITAAATASFSASAAEPTTNSDPAEKLGHATSCEETESAELIPDSVILEILGEDPTVSNNYGAEIHKDLAVRLEYIATHGLTKELRKEINEKYLLPTNCKLINAPALNAEIKAATSDLIIKRDKNIEIRQRQTAVAISCLSQAINRLISNSNADPELTKMLMDSERILCDSQYSDSVIRRNFILSSLKKEMKDQLQNTKPDNLLFGENLSETIKTAKAISKSGAELKTPMPKPQTNNKKPQTTANTSRNLNWKGPFPARKQSNHHPKTKGPPPNNRPSSSSRQSQQQPKRSRR